IYAVTNGYLDEINIELVRKWELGFQQAMGAKHQEVLDDLREGGALTDDVVEKLVAAIEGYNESFAAEHETAGASA
ncbi:MAG: F0F1 ATP synthase subunit alpha, partial [Gemmatimonadales bacterium]|nr:F0F1 ATP synthase subunit alpha [Gemmatimonadales bacterium]